MYTVRTTNRFEKNVALCKKRGYPMDKLSKAITILEKNGSLPLVYHPHKLVSKQEGTWECHLAPDWLLVWQQNDLELTLLMLQTGTHSDIF
ncbi:MAG: type II toxin-antitoxin system YafQ family toxin [Paludibacteraceae bacterium]|nr:type II toxin-antitoxin system YafQ family toxin [Paludibacteraceae bacterium]